MTNELLTIDAPVEGVDQADVGHGPLEDKLMLIGPRHDERTYIVEVRGLKDHADDLA